MARALRRQRAVVKKLLGVLQNLDQDSYIPNNPDLVIGMLYAQQCAQHLVRRFLDSQTQLTQHTSTSVSSQVCF